MQGFRPGMAPNRRQGSCQQLACGYACLQARLCVYLHLGVRVCACTSVCKHVCLQAPAPLHASVCLHNCTDLQILPNPQRLSALPLHSGPHDVFERAPLCFFFASLSILMPSYTHPSHVTYLHAQAHLEINRNTCCHSEAMVSVARSSSNCSFCKLAYILRQKAACAMIRHNSRVLHQLLLRTFSATQKRQVLVGGGAATLGVQPPLTFFAVGRARQAQAHMAPFAPSAPLLVLRNYEQKPYAAVGRRGGGGCLPTLEWQNLVRGNFGTNS